MLGFKVLLCKLLYVHAEVAWAAGSGLSLCAITHSNISSRLICILADVSTMPVNSYRVLLDTACFKFALAESRVAETTRSPRGD